MSEKVLFSTNFLNSVNSQHGVTVAFNENEEIFQVIYVFTDTTTNKTKALQISASPVLNLNSLKGGGKSVTFSLYSL